MKKMVCFVCVIAIAAGLSGCPVIGGSISAGKLVGTWQWVEAARLIDPTTVDDYDSEVVAQNFANNGRVRKTLVFDEEKNFTYTEETFLPDRQANLFFDKGVGVVWSWIQTYQSKGTFATASYSPANSILAVPGLSTELHVDVAEYTDVFAVNKRDTNGNLVRDSETRILVDYVTSTSASSAENPLVLRGLLGLNPFDELMVSWAQFVVGKDLSYNYSFSSNVETYIRLVVEE
jgi:hypothetical protein